MVNFLKGISEANSFLLDESDIDWCLQKVVEILGYSTQVDRCYIFTNHTKDNGKLMLEYTQEWCNINIEPQLGNPIFNDLYYDQFPGLYDELIENKPYFGLVRENHNKLFRETMEMQSIYAYLFTPIFCDSVFWGWIGYDDCTKERKWKQEDTEVLFTVARNIGLRLHREQSEKKFKISEEHLNFEINISKQGMWEWDLIKNKFSFSPNYMAMLGYKPNEFEHNYENWKIHVNPEDLIFAEKNLNDYLWKKTESYSVEIRMRHKNGHNIWIKGGGVAEWDEQGKPKYIFGTQMDITELKAQQALIEQQRNEYDELINNLAETVFKLNKNLEFSFLNNYWYIISGYNKHESHNHSLLNYILEEDKAKTIKHLDSLNKSENESKIFEVKIRNKEGNIRWVQIIARKYYIDSENEKSAIAGSIIDITERKETELKALELSELKSDFVTMASHQFRTPLTVIYSNIELLENYSNKIDQAVSVKLKTLGKRIKNEINRMTELMNNIILFGKHNSKVPSLSSKPLLLSKLCKKVVNNYFSAQQDKRVIEFEIINETSRLVNVDELLFTHILINIISNAFKYSEGERNPLLTINHKPDYLQIEVCDYGIGIPKNEIDKLFNSFYRASNTNTIKGSGLGLVVARQFMELHNGRIDLKSKLGDGCTVTLTFPYAKAKNSIS
jgi:PAS domain S-box-containing protein